MHKKNQWPGNIKIVALPWPMGGFLQLLENQDLQSLRGPRPKINFNVIFVEGRQGYQMLFTGSKNIDPSRIYCIFKIAKYIQ